MQLYHSEESITSIALNAGYETSAAFTKAFRFHFGKNPTDFKKSKKFSLTIKLPDLKTKDLEVKTMQPEIRTLPEQKVLFVRKTGKYDKAASEAWSTLMKFAYPRRTKPENLRTEIYVPIE